MVHCAGTWLREPLCFHLESEARAVRRCISASAQPHLLVAVEAGGVTEALLLSLVEKVLQRHPLVVKVETAVVAAVSFQALGGTKLGEASITADAVHHVPVADLVLNLQMRHSHLQREGALATVSITQRVTGNFSPSGKAG